MRARRAVAALLLAAAATGCLGPGGPAGEGAGGVVVERVSLSALFVTVGEPLGVEVVLANAGDARATRTLEVRVDGVAADRVDVALAPGERLGVAFVLVLTEVGPHVLEIDRARFEIVAEDPWRRAATSPAPASPVLAA